jgi:hypothetical protein
MRQLSSYRALHVIQSVSSFGELALCGPFVIGSIGERNRAERYRPKDRSRSRCGISSDVWPCSTFAAGIRRLTSASRPDEARVRLGRACCRISMLSEPFLVMVVVHVIHLATMFKADVFIMKPDAWSREAMWCARPLKLPWPTQPNLSR